MRARIVAVILACCLACQPAPGQADVTGTPEFSAMLASEFAPEETWAFARMAEAAGDPDAAIAAFEQLLIRYPDEISVHAELARLYAAVGNPELGALHAAEAGGERTRFWGRATVGAGYETNPLAAPRYATIRVFDRVSNLFINVPSAPVEDDALLDVSLDLSLAHRMSEDVLFTADLLANAEVYAENRPLDSLDILAIGGPWIAMGDSALGQTLVQPYGFAGAGMLDARPWYGLLGAGVALRVLPTDTMAVTLGADLSYTDYASSIGVIVDGNAFDNFQLRSGVEVEGSAGGTLWAVYVTAATADATAEFESYFQARAGAVVYQPFDALEDVLGLPVDLRLGLSTDHFSYRAPDPTIDPTQSRRDTWAGGDAALIFGLSDGFDFEIGVDYKRRFSNISAFDTQTTLIYAQVGHDF